MKFFRSEQIREIDALTILNEPVASIDLMERAAMQLFNWIADRFDRTAEFMIFAGPGNNGGDGIALARILAANRYYSEVYYVKLSDRESDDWRINFDRLVKETDVRPDVIDTADKFPLISGKKIIIDAIFGSGLTRPIEGLAAEIVSLINQSGSPVISVDIPSGLFGEDNSMNIQGNIVRADYTLSLQFPKLSFMFGENAKFLGDWIVLPIGLSPQAVRDTESPFVLTEREEIVPLLRKRGRFEHKGNFGHGLLIAGSYGKLGAAVLGAGAALRTGIGLLTCHIPSLGTTVMHTAVPGAMVHPDRDDRIITEAPDAESYDAVGIGPGIGSDPSTQAALHRILIRAEKPMVIDADGLNILGMNRKWLELIPPGSILTPHPKEFERITGTSGNSYERLMKQISFSKNFRSVVVLKGANTSITTPDGRVCFNSTGNPGMATAGSGDVLTGILLSLLAQGYAPEDAAVTGVFLHGLAGDIAAAEKGLEATIATDIIENTGKAFKAIRTGDIS